MTRIVFFLGLALQIGLDEGCCGMSGHTTEHSSDDPARIKQNKTKSTTRPTTKVQPTKATMPPTTTTPVIVSQIPRNSSPWISRMNVEFKKDNVDCAGVIVSILYILSAASCFIDYSNKTLIYPKMIKIFVVNLKTNKDRMIVLSKDLHTVIKKSPKFLDAGHGHDIALVQLPEPLSIEEIERIATIPFPSWTPKPGRSLDVSGWGFKDSKMNGTVFKSAVLQRTTVTVNPSKACGTSVPNNTFCAVEATNANSSARSDDCPGDKGWILTRTDPIGFDGIVVTVYGIGSYNVNCGKDGVVVVYTDVSKYHTWLVHILENVERAAAKGKSGWLVDPKKLRETEL